MASFKMINEESNKIKLSTSNKVPKKPIIPKQSNEVAPLKRISKHESIEIAPTEPPEPPKVENKAKEKLRLPFQTLDDRHLRQKAFLHTSARALSLPEMPAAFFTVNNINPKISKLEQPIGTVADNILAARYYLLKINETATPSSIIYSIIRLFRSIRAVSLLLNPNSQFTKNFASIRNLIIHSTTMMDFSEVNCKTITSDSLHLLNNLLQLFNLICNERKYLQSDFMVHLEEIINNSKLEALDLLKLNKDQRLPNCDEVLREINTTINTIQQIVQNFTGQPLLEKDYDQFATIKMLIVRIAEFSLLLANSNAQSSSRLNSIMPTKK